MDKKKRDGGVVPAHVIAGVLVGVPVGALAGIALSYFLESAKFRSAMPITQYYARVVTSFGPPPPGQAGMEFAFIPTAINFAIGGALIFAILFGILAEQHAKSFLAKNG